MPAKTKIIFKKCINFLLVWVNFLTGGKACNKIVFFFLKFSFVCDNQAKAYECPFLKFEKNSYLT